ncbi:MAG: VanZ family protein [Ruminococcus sp.]|nr:VanZ family protein [Ruminococcus sp.]
MKKIISRSPEKYRGIFLILTLALMTVIFVLSAQDADRSANTSSFLTRIMVKLMAKDYDSLPLAQQQEIWDKASFIVRKLAHFSIYTALGFCASFTAGKRKLLTVKSLGVLIFGFLYAASDEFHQHFVPGRSCEFRDMMIDTGGVTVGMIVSLIFMVIIAHFASKRRKS